MNRIALYVAGISATIATLMMFRDSMSLPGRFSTGPNRRVPARKAAEMLKEAWADHHTTA